jgi:hypothetical protein
LALIGDTVIVGIFINRDCYNPALHCATILPLVDTSALVKINYSTEINVTEEMPEAVSLMTLIFRELFVINSVIFFGAFVNTAVIASVM